MLAGMDTSGMNHITPGGRGLHREHPVWTVIGVTIAVLLAIGSLVVVGGTVLLFVGLSHYGSNK